MTDDECEDGKDVEDTAEMDTGFFRCVVSGGEIVSFEGVPHPAGTADGRPRELEFVLLPRGATGDSHWSNLGL